jgi:hypothetical protein
MIGGVRSQINGRLICIKIRTVEVNAVIDGEKVDGEGREGMNRRPLPVIKGEMGEAGNMIDEG